MWTPSCPSIVPSVQVSTKPGQLHVVEEAQAAVQEAAVVNVDETGWREAQQRAWLWAAVTATLTVVRIDRSRRGAAVAALLGADFRGVGGSGRWSGSTRFPAERRGPGYGHTMRTPA